MRICGFSFVRNGVALDYPFLESLSSLLPLCDEIVVAVGKSGDATLAQIRRLKSRKIRVILTAWDDSLRTGGSVLAQQTDIALDAVKGDWAFYLQADEVIHEREVPEIRKTLELHLSDRSVEGILFPYYHFYGSYEFVGVSRRWYRNEVRCIRPGIGIRSWRDAQGFRLNGRKLRVKPVRAHIYHYGWVRPPELQQRKQVSFHKLWHPDEWLEQNVGDAKEFDYRGGGRLERFVRTHPRVMQKRVLGQTWRFVYDPKKQGVSVRERGLEWVESWTGWRIGEYRNYTLI